MKHICTKCGHADEINPAKLLASIRTPKKEAAWKRNGEKLKQMYAEARMVKASFIPVPKPDFPQTAGRLPDKPRPPEDYVFPIPTRPTTLEGKKAAAMAALAGRHKIMPDARELQMGTWDKDLHNTPRAPFDVNLEGEPHRVTTMGKKLGLFYLGGGEPVFARYLEPGELEKFWERRIK
jgi:hypothetical protein